MEDERARVRARERKRRRRRQRRILLVTLILLILFLIGGAVYGVMRRGREKKKQELLKEGIELLNQGSYEEAVTRLDEALQWSKGKIGEFETNVLLYRADAEFRLRDYDAAQNTYELLSKENEENRDYKKGMARCLVEKGDYDGALALGVIDGYIYNLKAVEQIRAGEYDSALELIEKGKAAGDAMQDLSFNEAVVWENKGDFAKALELFEAYKAQYGTDENVERELEFLRSRQGNYGRDAGDAESSTDGVGDGDAGGQAASNNGAGNQDGGNNGAGGQVESGNNNAAGSRDAAGNESSAGQQSSGGESGAGEEGSLSSRAQAVG